MDDKGQMTIEELASQAGTATTTVRMYQAKGLLPPPERRGRIGYYGQGHVARLRLIAQLQEQGFSLASIKRLTDAWESGRGLEDILGLETQVAAVWAPEQPARLKLAEFKELFAGQRITPAVIQRAMRMGLVGFDGIWVTAKSPKLLEIGLELVHAGLPVKEMMDELEALQGMADSIALRFTAVFERNMWEPFVAAGLPAEQIRPLTGSLQRLSTLAEAVVNVALRDALRRKAGEFLAQQAPRLDSADIRDELRPLARAAGLDLDPLYPPAKKAGEHAGPPGGIRREFIEQRERHERMLGRLRARLLTAAAIQDGENVLDVGCGCGETTILAARTAGSGRALGADFSRIQVAEARRLAACAGVANARFARWRDHARSGLAGHRASRVNRLFR